MAQTLTVLQSGGKGTFSKLKIVAINVANGASETSITVEYKAYGLNSVILCGHQNRDTFTTGSQYDDQTLTSVVHTWTATDVANVTVWAIGF